MTPSHLLWRKSVGSLFPCARVFLLVLALVAAYTTLVVYCDSHYAAAQKLLDASAAMTLSVVMGVLLALRTNTAYDRWWEGRKLWGQLVNDSRNLALKLNIYLPEGEEKRELCGLLVAFPWSLMNHLRGQKDDGRIAALGFSANENEHQPMLVSRGIYTCLYSLHQRGVLTELQMLILDPHWRAYMDICGACERILKSPIAPTYKNMIWLGLGIYLLVLPWLLFPTLGYYTIVAVLISAYFFLGLELLAEEVEQPFGHDPNDLALSSICRTVEDSVQAAMNIQVSTPIAGSQYITLH